MATRSLLRHAQRLVGVALASCILTASPLTPSRLPQPAVPPQESASALPAGPASADPGVIAYLQRSTGDLHVIVPDGTGDQLLWSNPANSLGVPADLAWTRDGRQLAFTSGHEQTCSYYASDVYAIRSNGSGYRRITNAPACAELAALPQGSVTVDVTAAVSGAQVYVMGAQMLAGAPYPGGNVTVNNVADFGPGVEQPAVGVFGHYRTPAGPPYADVLPGQTVAGGHVSITNTGDPSFGAYHVAWKGDGSALAYGTGSCNALGYLPANPPYGSLGAVLPVVADADPCLVAFGPTAETSDQYVYYSSMGLNQETGYGGIYLNSLDNAGGGTKVVSFGYWDTAVFDIEWLPDGSGFLFTKLYILLDPVGTYSTIYKYDIASDSLSAVLTTREFCVRDLSISPDGQSVVFHTTADQYWDSTSSLRIVNMDGSGLRLLATDAGRPAWGPTYVPDTTAPTVNCGTPDGQWHANDASIACTASDSGSGLANPADASFSLSTSVPAGTETANAATGTRSVCDRDGNCATAGPIGGNRVDKKAPSITINSPSAAFYLLNQPVAASYSCSDDGSSVATCVGPVSNGSNIDTGSAGDKTFTVNASDAAGNTCSQSVDYTVGYRVWLPAILRP